MSLLLKIYKLLRDPRLKSAPAAWRLRSLILRRLSRELYRTPYLAGHAWIKPGNVIGDTALLTGGYEPEMTRIIQGYVKEGFNFVDV